MAKLSAAVPGSRLRGGGNLFTFFQIKRNADGTFSALTSGTDNLGDAFATEHVLGSHVESSWARDDKGSYSIDFTLIEMDIDHKNLMEMVSPITAASILKDPDLTLEDSTLLVNAEISGDLTMPYFASYFLGAPLLGKAQARLQVGQFKPVSQVNQKPTEWSQPKIKFQTVDANDFTPATSGNSAFSGITPVALSVPYQHGKWIAAP